LFDPKPTFEMPEGLVWNKQKRKAIQEATGFEYDPESGWLIDPENQVYYDLFSGYAFDPTENNLVDMVSGKRFHLETREELIVEVAAVEIGDQKGGQ
jgi:hypothetical protein